MTHLEQQAAVAYIIEELNRKTFKALTRVLQWVSGDCHHESLFRRAVEIIEEDYPKTAEWLQDSLEKLKV
ncbi:MAG: hypothetical protein ACFB4I_24370 [Cyanophyceae cyanobacterium]